jgi:two-component system response regulator HydG
MGASDLEGSIRTLRQAGTTGSLPFAGSLVLRVIDGPDKGASVVLDDTHAGRLLVGRSPACALKLDDERVSRRHFALEVVDSKVRLIDLGSTNGTRIDTLTVLGAELRGGEQILLGNTRIIAERNDQPPASALVEGHRFGRTLGGSREMRRLYGLCQKLAASRVPVLIEGETGTGKEVLAESIHEEGPRRDKPFVVFDCTTVPAALMESELFGHERGAFTGATTSRPGVFEQADGGTLLIDEIGDLELPLQAKLLRAFDRMEFRRLGGTKSTRVDVRLLVATRRDLDREIQAGRFRDDLFHRLAVARIELPPLRRRKGDLPLLVAELCRQLGSDSSLFDADLFARWEQYEWPGNIRELRNAVARKVELGVDLVLRPTTRDAETAPDAAGHADADGAVDVDVDVARGDAIAQAVGAILALDLPLDVARRRVIDEFEERYLERVLAANDGNVSRAALASGVARRHFHRLLARARSRAT